MAVPAKNVDNGPVFVVGRQAAVTASALLFKMVVFIFESVVPRRLVSVASAWWARISGVHVAFGRKALLSPALLVQFFVVVFVIGTSCFSNLKVALASEQSPLLFLSDKDYPPVNYLDGGIADGLGVDVARTIGKSLDREVRVELTDWLEAQEKMPIGATDGLPSIKHTEERMQPLDPISPTLVIGVFLLVLIGAMGLWVVTLKRQARVCKEAKMALRESEQRFRTFATASFEGIAVTVNGRYMDANEQLAAILGYERSELIGREVSSTIVPEDCGRVMENIEAGRDSAVEHGILRKDGSRGVVEARGRTLTHESGPVRYTVIRDMTEREIAHAALRESEQRLKTILHTANEGFWLIDTDSVTMDVNLRMCNILGRKREDILGKKIFDFVDNENGAIFERQMALRKDGEVGSYEIALSRPDGAQVCCQFNATPLSDESGSITGSFAMVTDISKRKQAEHSALRAMEDWEGTFDAVPDLIAILDKDYRIVRANRAMAAKLGVTPSECVGLTCYRAVHDTDYPPSYCPHRKLLENKTAHTVESYEECFGGYFAVTAAPLFDSVGKLKGSVHVCRDITKRKQIEDELRDSEVRFRNILQTANEGFVLVDNDGSIVDVNMKMCSILGRNREDILGRKILDFADSENKAVFKRQAGIREQGRPSTYEITLVRSDGAHVFCEFNATPLFERSGNKAGAFAMVTDISERKRAEIERELTVEFLRLVNESTEMDRMIRSASAFFQDRSGCRAIGIRLKNGDDYPYFESRGFPAEFVRVESSLCAHDGTGEVILDSTGSPVLSCMCGKVIRGVFDPSKPFFTKNGSFWTNSTTELLATSTEEERQARTRNRCNGEGYESVALIPLHTGENRIGLLQMNDERKGRFSPEDIALWERLAGYLAIALAKFQSEEQLRESEEQFKTIFATASVGIVQADPKTGRLLRVNQKMCEMTGYSAEELVRMSIPEITHPEDRELHLETLRNFASGESEDFRIEKRYIRKDGTVMWGSVNASIILDSGGQPIRTVATVEDITERKRLEESLRKSEARFRVIVENSHDGIIFADNKGVILYRSPSYRAINGYDDEDRVGKDGFETVHLDDLPATRQVWTEMLSHPESLRKIQYRIRHKDGTWRWVETFVRNFLDNPNVRAVVVTTRDITEHKHSEETLREREEIYSAIVGQAAEGIVLIDTETLRFVEFNDAACRGLGYSREEFAGLKLSDVQGTLTEKEVIERVGVVVEVGHGNFENQHRRKDGSLRDALVSNRAIKLRGHVYLVTIWLDISERKRSDAERTRAEGQLRQAMKMEALGTLAGGIAHDFNNILGVIVGYSEMAQSEADDPARVREHIYEVLRGADRAKDLVQQILVFSRQREIEKKPVEVGLLVKEALKMLRASLPSTIEIKQHVASRAIVMADPTQIHQVLMNLCANSAHAMGGNVGTMQVTLTDVRSGQGTIQLPPELGPGSYVKLTVKDTGHGIDPSIVDRIFDPFFTTKELGTGTGLGLSVVHGIVKDHGGTIAVGSRPGEGTAFDLFFPAVGVAAQPAAVAPATLPRGRERILVVDDEPLLARITKQMLERLGYKVDSHTSAIDALEAVRSQYQETPFDLVITDMTMPRLTGVDLARELINLQPNLAILLCTGFSERVDKDMAESLGIQGLLMKPVALQELAEMVRRILDERMGRV